MEELCLQAVSVWSGLAWLPDILDPPSSQRDGSRASSPLEAFGALVAAY